MSTFSERFSDFEILIAAQRADGVYPVKVIESPAGQAQGELALTTSVGELEVAVERIRSLDTDEAFLIDFGTRLFSALFSGRIHSCYAESVGMTSKGKGLRIRLHIASPELAMLPWELLYDSEKREFLGLSKRTLVTRYLDVPRAPNPLRTELPLRLLIAEASPGDLPPLDIEAEVGRIKEALSHQIEHGLIQLDFLQNTTARALRDKLMEPFHVLHFIGHGGFQEGVGCLALEDQSGNTELVSGRTLGMLLKSKPVQLVVLNVCQSSQDANSVQAFAGVAPALVDAGVLAVVAMQFAVADDSALAFAQDFYGMLSHYLPVDECVSRAREGLMLDFGISHVDWATPVLFLRAPDGVIFIPQGVDQAADECLDKTYIGDLSTPHRDPVAIVGKLPKEREIVNHLWAMADCPSYKRWAEPDETISQWVARYDDGYWDEATRQLVSDVVDQQPITIILGDSGMGKTAILEWLTFLYTERVLRGDADDPNKLIPIFVKLSQYAGEDSLVPLVRIGLNRHGQIKLSSEQDDIQTRTLLAERKFIILIDAPYQIPGGEAARARGISAICRFLDEYPQHKYVITCNSSTYDDQFHGWGGEWIVLPHSDEDVKAYFIRRFEKSRGIELYEGLSDRMRELARIPLLLSMLLDELSDLGDKAAKHPADLLANFVSRSLSRGGATISVEAQKTLLSQLAYQMKLDKTQQYSQAKTLEIFAKEARKGGLQAITPRDILGDLIASGLLRTGSTSHIAFSHARFQDYFATLVVQEQFDKGTVNWETLCKGYWWHEVVLLLSSIVQQPGVMVEKLLAHNPLLAAECLLEGRSVNGTLRRQIVEALVEKEELGTEKEKAESTQLLTELQSAGIVREVASYRRAIDARTDDSGEWPTSVALYVRGNLVITRGPLAGHRFPLLDGLICLGRSRQANIRLRHSSVSRLHAEIKVEGDRISIQDVGSTNGTQVNGQQITAWRQLKDGDEILLGDLPLTLHVQQR